MEDFDFSKLVWGNYNIRDETLGIGVLLKISSYISKLEFLRKKMLKLFNNKINIDKIQFEFENKSSTDFISPMWHCDWIPKKLGILFNYYYYLLNIYNKEHKLPESNNTFTETIFTNDFFSMKMVLYQSFSIVMNKYLTMIRDNINDLDSKIEKEFDEKAKKQAIIDSRITELQELIRKKHESIDKTISELTANINTIDDAMKLFISKFDEVLINNQKMNEQLQQCMYNQAQLVKIIKMAFMFKSDMFNEEQQKMIESCLEK
jgi:hypothetical protein